DGYTRYPWCMLLGRHVGIVEIEFADRSAVKRWIWETHLGHRNLSAEAKAYGRGTLFNARKPTHRGGDHKTEKSKLQSATLKSTADELAQQHCVDRVTIYRDGRFATALDQVAAVCGADIRDRVLARDLKWTRGDVERLAKQPPEVLREVVAAAL